MKRAIISALLKQQLRKVSSTFNCRTGSGMRRDHPRPTRSRLNPKAQW